MHLILHARLVQITRSRPPATDRLALQPERLNASVNDTKGLEALRLRSPPHTPIRLVRILVERDIEGRRRSMENSRGSRSEWAHRFCHRESLLEDSIESPCH